MTDYRAGRSETAKIWCKHTLKRLFELTVATVFSDPKQVSRLWHQGILMKIDIHLHTKQYKSGDPATRNVTPEKFCDKILSTDVGIACVTNHNGFDLYQYKNIESALGGEAQIWPGIELDVTDDGIRGHLLVIVPPEKAEPFSEAVTNATEGQNPDTFSATIDNVVEVFDKFGPLYVAHYKQKKPDLPDKSIDKLIERTKNPSRVIKEVTNSISAGIYISHGYPSIYGSDVHNWDEYEALARDLPDLRLPVDGFEHFCLLLEKDPTTINTVLERKTSETLNLEPFDDETEITLQAYNDINVIFGAKGTGKTCILRAIENHYSARGISAKMLTSASDRLDEIYDTKCKDITINLEPYDINYCTDEITSIRGARESDVTMLDNFLGYFRVNNTNKNAKRIHLKEIDKQDERAPKRRFREYKTSAERTERFIKFLETDGPAENELEEGERRDLVNLLSTLLGRLREGEWKAFSEWKEVGLLNSAIEKFRSEVSKKTGTPSKPSTTGFREYALNRLTLEANAREVLRNVDTNIPEQVEEVGNLGPGKGVLECRTKIVVQDGKVTDGTLGCVKGVRRKGAQKEFIKAVDDIAKNVYSDGLFTKVAALNAIDDVDDIKTVNELLLFKRYFAIDGKEYCPSSGEASMLMLQKELEEEKDIYILDEPERSLGNDYINDMIVPLLKERAREGKRIFISTHDANIAVRTLPYNSVYRCHGKSGYETYSGNPFSNDLVNVGCSNEALDWKKTSMRTLEGGEEAFGERGKIYGSG